MGLFRRRQETLNEQLLREAGLDPEQMLGDPPPPPPLPAPSSWVLGAVGVPDGSTVGPKEWDAAVTATAPGLVGDRVEFTTIPNGDVIVTEESGDADLSPLADAVEQRVSPPYRAVGQRQDGDLWAVGARRIQVATIPFADGEKLTLSQHGSDSELRVDGEPSNETAPVQLEALGQAVGDSFYVEAQRIDGDLWEVQVAAF